MRDLRFDSDFSINWDLSNRPWGRKVPQLSPWFYLKREPFLGAVANLKHPRASPWKLGFPSLLARPQNALLNAARDTHNLYTPVALHISRNIRSILWTFLY